MTASNAAKGVVRRDLAIGVCLMAIALFLWFWLIPNGIRMPSRMPNLAMSPALWPRMVVLLMGLCGLWLAIETVVRSMKPGADRVVEDDDGLTIGNHRDAWRLAAAILLLPLYYVAARELGMVVPSIAAFIVYAMLAGERSWLTVIALGVAVPAVVTLFFMQAANIVIPLGPLDPLFY